MRPDVADGTQRPALVGLEAPVPIGVMEEPVLEVVAGHEPDVAELSVGHHLAHVLVERVEADVEVDCVDEAARPRLVDEAGGFIGGQGERLLADDVLAGGENGRCLRNVEMIRRCDVHDVDGGVRQDVVERSVGVADAQPCRTCRAPLRRAAEDAAHVDADPAELLDVDGPDEPGPDDRGTDVGERAHSAPDGDRDATGEAASCLDDLDAWRW